MFEQSNRAVLAIDAGGTYFKSALVDGQGNIVPDSCLQTPADSDGTKQEIIAVYERSIRSSFDSAANKGFEVAGIGISTPGPFDYERGMSLMKHKFQAVREIPLRDEFYSLGIFDDSLPIVFMQDVHAFLTGEHWTGAVKNFNNIAAITLGTGLGFGLMQGGKILDDGKGGPCLSIFNRPYENGVLEDIASRRGIIARCRKHDEQAQTGSDVLEFAEQARAGNKPAAWVFNETGEILGKELAEILDEYKIQAVVFGGQISKSFDLFGPAFSGALSQRGLKIPALPGKNIGVSALTGAAKKLI